MSVGVTLDGGNWSCKPCYQLKEEQEQVFSWELLC